jgi:hypothetical protein
MLSVVWNWDGVGDHEAGVSPQADAFGKRKPE